MYGRWKDAAFDRLENAVELSGSDCGPARADRPIGRLNNAAELIGSDCGTARADRRVTVRGSGEEVVIDNGKVRGID